MRWFQNIGAAQWLRFTAGRIAQWETKTFGTLRIFDSCSTSSFWFWFPGTCFDTVRSFLYTFFQLALRTSCHCEGVNFVTFGPPLAAASHSHALGGWVMAGILAGTFIAILLGAIGITTLLDRRRQANTSQRRQQAASQVAGSSPHTS